MHNLRHERHRGHHSHRCCGAYGPGGGFEGRPAPHGVRCGRGPGFGPVDGDRWYGPRVRPDQAVLEARLAYMIAWRNRLDAVIQQLSERLETGKAAGGTAAEPEDKSAADDPQA